MKPLLLCNTERYTGPWVPVNGNGQRKVEVVGLGDGDEVVVTFYDGVLRSLDMVFTEDGFIELNEPWVTLVRGERRESSGREISAWVQ